MTYPTDRLTPRTIENLPGEMYDPAKTKQLFVEDIIQITDDLRAVEDEIEDVVKPALGDVADLIATAIANVKLALHPINSLYFNTANVNPSTFIGGTWIAWGSGRVPIGVDTGQTEFNTVEKTGGAKTVTLTEAQMPSHKHNSATSIMYDVGVSDTQFGLHFSNVAGYRSSPTGDSAKGSGSAHANLPPYITCYIFKRTA